MGDFPELDVMSPDAEAMLMAPTDPNECACGHDGLPAAWHLQDCTLSPHHH
jgi:hypothetical protein